MAALNLWKFMIYAEMMDWLVKFIGWNLWVPRGERRFKF